MCSNTFDAGDYAVARYSVIASRSRGEGRFGQAGRISEPILSNRLILRAVLRQVSPMVIRLLSVSDRMELSEFHRVIERDGTLYHLDYA